jgi:hypothetical protein
MIIDLRFELFPHLTPLRYQDLGGHFRHFDWFAARLERPDCWLVGDKIALHLLNVKMSVEGLRGSSNTLFIFHSSGDGFSCC